MRYRRFVFLLVFSSWLGLSGCGQGSLSETDFDFAGWRADKNGCSGQRAILWESLRDLRPQLLGRNEMEIVRLLGTPDKRSLLIRNQKVALYFLDPGPTCTDARPAEPRRLRVLFNALNQAKEIAVVVVED